MLYVVNAFPQGYFPISVSPLTIDSYILYFLSPHYYVQADEDSSYREKQEKRSLKQCEEAKNVENKEKYDTVVNQ